MDVEKMKGVVKKLVQEVLDEHAAVGLDTKVKEALKKAEETVEALTEQITALQQKTSDDASTIEKMEQDVEKLSSEVSAKVEEFDALQAAHEEVKAEAASAKGELENLRKEALVKERMSELEGLKVARSGEALKRQIAAVKELSDEEFSAYKDDLVALREEFLSAAAKESKPDEGGEEGSKDKAGKDGVKTPPADIEGAKEDASVLPNGSDGEGRNKYKDFSEGLCILLKNSRNAKEDKR